MVAIVVNVVATKTRRSPIEVLVFCDPMLHPLTLSLDDDSMTAIVSTPMSRTTFLIVIIATVQELYYLESQSAGNTMHALRRQ